MAQSNEQKKSSYRLKLLEKAVLAPEARNEAAKGEYPAGHFKKFFDVFRSNFQQIVIANMLTLIFAVPLIAVILVFSLFGAEAVTYFICGIDDAPYLLSGFGFGLSSGVVVLSTIKAQMVISYRILICAIAVCLPILSVGFAGNLYIATKNCWGESFVTKKDKYGNDVPRIVFEFFNGVKKYWKETLIIMSITAVMVAGVGNMILTFVEGLWGNCLNGGHYVCLIFGILIGLAYLFVFINWLPLVTSYNIGLLDKLRNAALMSVAFPLPTLFMLIFVVGPFLLLLIGSVVAIILGIAVLTIGLSYVIMVMVHYSDYNSEQVLVPMYEMSIGIGTNKKKDKKDKKERAQNSVYSNSYKRKK